MEAHEIAGDGLTSSREDREPWPLAAAQRALDFVGATLILILLSPILIAIAIAIRLDSPGPALFRQRRVGLRGREFTVFKFRSMCMEADPKRHREYVTALIRRWSLDELPQLFNVVRGDMSLVGPRPAISYEVAEYPGWYMRRFDTKPGMTGLWQINGRNERTYEEMVRLDIDYVERRSLLLDISILARTPWTVVSRRGAS
jgi:lipopolysaccharide/colanic/teichoic acid biosynthesis glycosyltransferase